jgi:hypothetical protein
MNQVEQLLNSRLTCLREGHVHQATKEMDRTVGMHKDEKPTAYIRLVNDLVKEIRSMAKEAKRMHVCEAVTSGAALLEHMRTAWSRDGRFAEQIRAEVSEWERRAEGDRTYESFCKMLTRAEGLAEAEAARRASKDGHPRHKEKHDWKHQLHQLNAKGKGNPKGGKQKINPKGKGRGGGAYSPKGSPKGGWGKGQEYARPKGKGKGETQRIKHCWQDGECPWSDCIYMHTQGSRSGKSLVKYWADDWTVAAASSNSGGAGKGQTVAPQLHIQTAGSKPKRRRWRRQRATRSTAWATVCS